MQVNDPQLLHDFEHLVAGPLDFLFLAFARVGQRLERQLHTLMLNQLTTSRVRFRDFVGQFFGFHFINAQHLDFDQIGAAFFRGIHHPLELGEGFVQVGHFPTLHQIQLFDDLRQRLLRRDNLKFRREKCRAPQHGLAVGNAIVKITPAGHPGGTFNLHQDRPWILLRHDRRDDRRRHEHKKERQQNNPVTITDHLPIIERVEPSFALLLVHNNGKYT